MKRIGEASVSTGDSSAKTLEACALFSKGGQSVSYTYVSRYLTLATVQGSRHCCHPHFADQEWETVSALFQAHRLNVLLLKTPAS